MYRSLLISILLLAAINGYAQQSARGIITDTGKVPVSGCHVGLLRANDSSKVKEAITNADGAFQFDSLLADSYIVKAYKNGFGNYTSAVFKIDAQSRADIGTITLQYTGFELKEAAVRAFKPSIEFKNGVVVMNVENNAIAQGLTVLELLKMVPGVVMDVQGNITVNGKSGVGFMMNGRLQQVPAKQMLQMLGSMSAESVSSIQLIKNPSAKYDAAGTAGLIDIISKKVRVKGFSGNVSENASYGQQAGSVTAATLNFRSDKLTVFTNVNYWYRDIVTENTMRRTINDGPSAGIITSKSEGGNFKNAFNVKGGLEYELSNKITIGGSVAASPNTSDILQPAITNVGPGVALSYNRLYNATNINDQFNSPSVNVYALYADTNGTQLKFTADYTNFNDDYSSINESRFYDNGGTEVSPMLGYKNFQRLNFNIYTQKLDLTQKLSRSVVLEAGAKSSFVNNKSNLTLDRNDPGTDSYYTDTTLSNRYTYKERILAGYINLIKEAHNTSWQAGVRAEQTNVDAVNTTSNQPLHQDYLNLFPNASFNYKINEKNSLQLTYSYRIDRPGYDQLNPLRVFSDPLNYGTGNPQLQPQYSHSLGVEYSYNNFITTSLSYVHTNNSIYNYSYLDAALIQVDTTINYSHSDQVVYNLFVQKQVAKWYSLQASANVMYGIRNGIINGANTSEPTLACSFTANNDILLLKSYKLQVNGVYNSPFKDGIQSYGARGSLDVALQKRFFKNKLNAIIQVNDLLHTNNIHYTNTLPGQSIYLAQHTDSRRIRLVLSYRFGNMRVDRKVHDDEESKRIKKGS